MLKNKRKTVGLRLSEKSNAKIKELSEENECSLSNVINFIFENMTKETVENIELFNNQNFVNEFIELTKKYKG